VKLLHFTRAVQLILSGHWFGPVARRAGPGLAQPMWAELGPAPKITKIIKK